MKQTIYIVFATLLFAAFSSCTNPQNPDVPVTKDFCGVPPSMLVQMIRNYKTEVWTKTSDVPGGKADARFMEISIEQLENFLAYAKQSAQKDGLNVSSVRIYYINYPGIKKTQSYLAEHKTGNVFEDYAGCHSLALVPVVGSDMHDPERRDYYKQGMSATAPMNPADFQTTSAAAMIFVPNNCSANSPMENHNELCPPFRGCEHNSLIEIADM